jgi:hypothetical protein
VDPVSTPRGSEGGIPRSRKGVAAPLGGARREESWVGANEAKAEKLRGRTLQRRADARGLALRHSAYGYALIDSTRRRVDDRSDMTLDEIESWLDRAP